MGVWGHVEIRGSIASYCPHTTTYVSVYVSLYCYICVSVASTFDIIQNESTTDIKSRLGSRIPSSYRYKCTIYVWYMRDLILLFCGHICSYCYKCVRILLYMCPHPTICVLILLYMCPHHTICVLILLYMCPHPTICVLILLYMCPHHTICVLILLYVCPHPTICVLILLCMCNISSYSMRTHIW